MTTLILADEIHLNALELRLAEEEIRLEEYLKEYTSVSVHIPIKISNRLIAMYREQIAVITARQIPFNGPVSETDFPTS